MWWSAQLTKASKFMSYAYTINLKIFLVEVSIKQFWVRNKMIKEKKKWIKFSSKWQKMNLSMWKASEMWIQNNVYNKRSFAIISNKKKSFSKNFEKFRKTIMYKKGYIFHSYILIVKENGLKCYWQKYLHTSSQCPSILFHNPAHATAHPFSADAAAAQPYI